MKFRVLLKDPDSFYEEIDDAAEKMAAKVEGIDEDEFPAVVKMKREKIVDIVSEWVEYGEYICIEFDTQEKTATVLTVAEANKK